MSFTTDTITVEGNINVAGNFVKGGNTITIPSSAGTITLIDESQTLTNKTISGTSNTISDVPQSALTGLLAITGILKSTGAALAQAVAGTDFVAPNAAITGATNTKITYDAKGLVTAGAAATTADISDSTNRRYLTDAQQTALATHVVGPTTATDNSVVRYDGTTGKLVQDTSVTVDDSNRVGIAVTPTAGLHVRAGSATANTAPIKLVSGALLAAPEVGAIEFLTDRIIFTGTTGTTRKDISDFSYRGISALRTLDGSDELVNCTTGSFVVTLPTAVGFTKEYTIKNSGTGTITINTTSAQTVDAYTSGQLTLTQYQALTVRSNGSNWVIVYVTPVYGTYFQYAESDATSTNATTTMTTKVTFTTPTLPAGNYYIGYSYQWRHSAATSDFRAQARIDGTIIHGHNEEPSDATTIAAVSGFKVSALTNTTHTVDIQFAAEGGTATISNARIEIYRVS